MILPSQPGLFRRLIYSDYIRRRNNLSIIGRQIRTLRREIDDRININTTDNNVTNSTTTNNVTNSTTTDNNTTDVDHFDTYEYLVNLPNVEVGLSVAELQRVSKIGLCTKPFFCCICQDTTDKVVEITRETFCKHVFHINCIESWLSKNKSCPVCRTHFE